MNLGSAARALGGDATGRQVVCPGPGHSARDRSLSVRFTPTAPDGFIVFSHAGDDIGECRDHVRARLGLPSRERSFHGIGKGEGQTSPKGVVTTTPTVAGAAAPPIADGDAKRISAARDIWEAGREPRDTIVEHYLTKVRGVPLPEIVAEEAIRFHPRCPWRDDDGRLVRVPAMVAAMRSVKTQEMTGVHRTRLTPDGHKVDRRMLGKASEAAIMLAPYPSMDASLAIAEGIESALAGWALGWSMVWAIGSAGGISNFPIICGVQSLVLLAENDVANRRAVSAVGQRYAESGREVVIVRPTMGKDAADVIGAVAA